MKLRGRSTKAASILASTMALGAYLTSEQWAHAAPIVTTCGEQLTGKVMRITGKAFTLAFTSTPAPFATGDFFSMDVAVCPIGQHAAPTALKIDAIMPAHQHGMNYTPTVKMRANQTYRAEGLLFHMPGLWELRFDVTGNDPAHPERLTYRMELD